MVSVSGRYDTAMRSRNSTYLKGAVYGVAAASIWAGWSAITRLAVTTALDAWDIAALRFGVAGVLLLPTVVRRGLALDRLGWTGLVLLVAGAGVPYVLLAAGGLRFAPAYDQSTLSPGFMPLFVALIAHAALGERMPSAARIGLALILAGADVIVTAHGGGPYPARTAGHVLFLSAAFLWACFTVVMRRAALDPLHATAIVATGSALIYLPIYFAWRGTEIFAQPVYEIAIQVIFQGFLVTVVSLVFYGRAIALLGASGGAAFGALVPVLSAFIAIPLLGKWPSLSDWIGIGLVSVGVYLASGGLMIRRRQK